MRHSEFALPTSSLKAKYAATKSHQEITMGASTKKKKIFEEMEKLHGKGDFFQGYFAFFLLFPEWTT